MQPEEYILYGAILIGIITIFIGTIGYIYESGKDAGATNERRMSEKAMMQSELSKVKQDVKTLMAEREEKKDD